MDLCHPLLASLLLMAPPLLGESGFSNGGYDPAPHPQAGREVHSHDKHGNEVPLVAVDGCAHCVPGRK